MRAPCLRCGVQLYIGEGPMVTVSFKPLELSTLIMDTTDMHMQDRLLCALGTIDQEAEKHVRNRLSE